VTTIYYHILTLDGRTLYPTGDEFGSSLRKAAVALVRGTIHGMGASPQSALDRAEIARWGILRARQQNKRRGEDGPTPLATQ